MRHGLEKVPDEAVERSLRSLPPGRARALDIRAEEFTIDRGGTGRAGARPGRPRRYFFFGLRRPRTFSTMG